MGTEKSNRSIIKERTQRESTQREGTESNSGIIGSGHIQKWRRERDDIRGERTEREA